MKKRTGFSFKPLLLALLFGAALLMGGCSDGDDGRPGLSAYEIAVQSGFTGTQEEWLESLSASADVEPESCSICHTGTVARNGDSHQEAYDELFQHGVVQVTNVTYTFDATNHVVEFNMTKQDAAGVDQPFDCTQADALNIYFVEYTGLNDQEFTSVDLDASGDGDRLSIKGADDPDTVPVEGTVTYTAGTNLCTSTMVATARGDLSAINGIIVVYGQDELIQTFPGHISLAKFPFAALLETGPVGVDYISAANATGCEHCHTTPYYKHGYILADVGQGVGDLDFYTCKACHIDNGDGGHQEWQLRVDDPQYWASGLELTPEQQAKYAYTTRLMNDVHMSHSMEFPYPQSIANCATCHAGKLTATLSDANFTLETCKSCHPVDGGTDTANADGEFAFDTRAVALNTIIPHGWDDTTVCNSCHTTGGIGPVFSTVHTGYDAEIYADTAGNKYSQAISVSIDSVAFAANVLTIDVTASGTAGGLSSAAIVPTLMVGLYGWDSKDFIVGPHERDADRNRLLEFELGETNPRVTGSEVAAGSWQFTADLSMWADRLADGSVKRAEIAIMPTLEDASGQVVALNAPSRTFDLTANAFDDDFFSPIVEAENCNSCHDALATTFHSGNRGGNIVVCRMCHITRSGGSHLQGQSRSIDSYVHAVHSFQAFDIDEIDFTDPVEKALYEEHIEFLFPDFAVINCMACHNAGRFNVPDQSKSMPGLLSPQDEIPGVSPIATPEVVVGPAARACGACHRAQFLNENDAAGAIAFNQHTKDFGYRVENDADDTVLNEIIETIMSMFQ